MASRVLRVLMRQVKIKNPSRKLDRIGARRIRTFPFSSDSAFDSVAYDPAKTRLSESQVEAEKQTNHNASSQALRVLPFCLRLRQFTFHWTISDGTISGIGTLLWTPSV